jgi:hypothetical protein
MTIDWTAVLVALLANTVPSVLAYLAWREARKTHREVNSKMTVLLKVIRQEGYLEGRRDEKADNP